MVWACCAYAGKGLWWGNLMERDHLKGQDPANKQSA
jgi:hypothetical protein